MKLLKHLIAGVILVQSKGGSLLQPQPFACNLRIVSTCLVEVAAGSIFVPRPRLLSATEKKLPNSCFQIRLRNSSSVCASSLCQAMGAWQDALRDSLNISMWLGLCTGRVARLPGVCRWSCWMYGKNQASSGTVAPWFAAVKTSLRVFEWTVPVAIAAWREPHFLVLLQDASVGPLCFSRRLQGPFQKILASHVAFYSTAPVPRP